MSSIELEYKDEALGLSVVFDFATEVIRFGLSNNIWFTIARLIIKTIDKLFLQPGKKIFVRVMEFREELILEWVKSEARIQAGKLIEITRVYEQKKEEVENDTCFSTEVKVRLKTLLDRDLEMRLAQIMVYR